MDWKTLILIAVVHNVLSLPLEFCCSDNNESNLIKYPSSGPILDAESPSSELYFFGHRPLIMNPNVPLKDDDNCNEPSCDNKKNLKFSSRSLREKPIVAVGPQLHRTKRFPIHLDPLYQYRYLARSGQCPTAKDGQPEFYCPTPDKQGNWRCIDDFQLCDGVRHCPNGEDELPVSCLFYRVVETHLLSVSQRLNSYDDDSHRHFSR